MKVEVSRYIEFVKDKLFIQKAILLLVRALLKENVIEGTEHLLM